MAVVIAFVVIGSGAILLDVVPFGGGTTKLNVAALMAGATLAGLFGFVDDRWQIRARWQLLLQLVLVAVAVAGGVTLARANNPVDFLGESMPRFLEFAGPAAIAVTAVWIVGMINSINFVDGLDGLSTGIGLIAALTLGVISVVDRPFDPTVALLSAVLAGSLAGFLPWNFHPARVFIGTTGVFAVGYALAVLAILGSGKVAVALLVLGVPIIDTFWIIIRRLASGRSPFTPDRGHLHHRLLDLGLTHRGAVLLIYGLCVLLGALSLVLAGSSGPLYAFMGIVVGGGLILFLLTRRSQSALDARSYPDTAPAGHARGDGSTVGGGGSTRDDGRRHEARPAR
jgi:UDP-GlcNAc:undecaprenyl-phosphate GlcNAc-1-phosphate transferase